MKKIIGLLLMTFILFSCNKQDNDQAVPANIATYKTNGYIAGQITGQSWDGVTLNETFKYSAYNNIDGQSSYTINSNGNYIWAKKIGGTGNDHSYSIDFNSAGYIYITGGFSGSNVDFDSGTGQALLSSMSGYDTFVTKYDLDGNYIWAKRAGGSSDDVGYAIDSDTSGNVYVTGYFQSSNFNCDPGNSNYTLSTAGSADMFLIKYDSSGNYTWAKQVGGVGYDAGRTLNFDQDGNIYVQGQFQNSNVDFDPGTGQALLSSSGDYDAFMLKLDSSGGYITAKRIGGTSGDIIYSSDIDSSNNIYVTGRFNLTVNFDPNGGTTNLTSTGGNDVFIAKYDSSYNLIWAKNVGNSGDDRGWALKINSSDLYVSGNFSNTVDFDPSEGVAELTQTNGSLFLLKLNNLGDFVYAKKLEGIGEYTQKLAINSTGDIYLSGAFSGTGIDFDPGPGQALLSSAGDVDIFVTKFIPMDTTPASFSFTPQTGIDISTLTLSNAITISGINYSSPISLLVLLLVLTVSTGDIILAIQVQFQMEILSLFT